MTPVGPDRAGRRWWVVVGILTLVGAGCLWAGVRSHPVTLGLPDRPAHRAPATGVRPASAPTSTVGLARSAPVALGIPAIGVSVFVSQLGLNPDQTVQVPTDDEVPGWFRLGPSPGQVGSAVILGHVDSQQGPAVFFNLRLLVPGDRVEVGLADGAVVTFAVTSVAMYTKDQFPAQQVYGSHGYPGLQLVTCGGTFDAQTGHYLSNIVVSTTLVTTHPSAGA